MQDSWQHNSHSHQGATARREFETMHMYADYAPTLVHVSMLRDDALDSESDEMDVAN